jgi:predicted SAM-dependent methyltransferase
MDCEKKALLKANRPISGKDMTIATRRLLRRNHLLLKLYKLWLMSTIAIRKKLDSQPRVLMVDVGAGLTYKRHWKTLDYPSEFYDSALTIDYVFDLMSFKKLPLRNSSVRFFYCDHVLEHITNEAVQHLFIDMYRCLEDGGALRILVPDIELAYEAYAKGNWRFFLREYLSLNRDFLRSEHSLEKFFLHYFAGYVADRVNLEEVKRGFAQMSRVDFLDFYSLKAQDVVNKNPIIQKKLSHFHMNWFDYEKLADMLRKAGFSVIYRSAPQESKFPQMVGPKFDPRTDSLIMEAANNDSGIAH